MFFARLLVHFWRKYRTEQIESEAGTEDSEESQSVKSSNNLEYFESGADYYDYGEYEGLTEEGYEWQPEYDGYEAEDYGTDDYAQLEYDGYEDNGEEDYGTDDYAQLEYDGYEDNGEEDYGTDDYAQLEYDGYEDNGEEDYGTDDYAQLEYDGYEDNGEEDYGTDDYAQLEYDGYEDNGAEDYGTDDYEHQHGYYPEYNLEDPGYQHHGEYDQYEESQTTESDKYLKSSQSLWLARIFNLKPTKPVRSAPNVQRSGKPRTSQVHMRRFCGY